jgi:hypothetical protein
MARIVGEIIIDGPAEEEFGSEANQRNEPRYNPRMARAAEVSDGPVGKGTVFDPSAKSMGRAAGMRGELTGCDRPGRLASRATTRQADIDGTLTFDPVPGGTWMRWSWSVRPRGGGQGAGAGDFLDRPTPGAGDLGELVAVPGNPAATAVTAPWTPGS